MSPALKNTAAQSLALSALTLLAVAALLLPSLGPLLDHHFAERHPAHGHLYLGSPSPEHTHPFRHSHTHHDAHYAAHYNAMYAPAPNDYAPSPGDIVFFAPTSNGGLSHASPNIAAPPSTPAPRFNDAAPPLYADAAPAAVLRGLTVAPPRQPPKS